MEKTKDREHDSRRAFIVKAAFACTGLPFLGRAMAFPSHSQKPLKGNNMKTENLKTSIIGGYGQWAGGLSDNPPNLSFRNETWEHVEPWKKTASEKARELVAAPKITRDSAVNVVKKYTYDGLEVEELSWQLSNGGRPTQAILLKPQGAKGKLPAILALHDHGGNKYFGKRKITKVSDEMHPMMEAHQKLYYSGRAWANDIAKKGYVVLVHDTFTFGSRRVQYQDIAGIPWGDCSVEGKTDQNPEELANIQVYNRWAAYHEHIMSKSLFCAGTTWPGVTLAEDRAALDVLIERPDVDTGNIGCGGLSGGGLRTDYLAGLDPRIKCAVSVGFMSTWKDFVENKSYTHTWMTFTPLLPQYLDFPEILGLRVPLATLVQSNNEDNLYTHAEMKKADGILREVYAKAGAADNYRGKFYDGDHKFDSKMQADAFDWFDSWLK
ncbi:hypothetical protein K8352_04805 [Flavobacteriaceae bacterium F89]|uniref:Uncharacterized protein n=1 Tax=Cerina litoralis TaxID=2874477 RepID=A0AAE3ES51_9FLAO|nr:alpha/beta hydrolase family protein [Cerina litoralis]MCG2460055.1 hypothetical protein [Cerina litoralis]